MQARHEELNSFLGHVLKESVTAGFFIGVRNGSFGTLPAICGKLRTRLTARCGIPLGVQFPLRAGADASCSAQTSRLGRRASTAAALSEAHEVDSKLLEGELMEVPNYKTLATLPSGSTISLFNDKKIYNMAENEIQTKILMPQNTDLSWDNLIENDRTYWFTMGTNVRTCTFTSDRNQSRSKASKVTVWKYETMQACIYVFTYAQVPCKQPSAAKIPANLNQIAQAEQQDGYQCFVVVKMVNPDSFNVLNHLNLPDSIRVFGHVLSCFVRNP